MEITENIANMQKAFKKDRNLSLTEMANELEISSSTLQDYLGSVGTPIPGVKVGVINQDMQECKTNEIGEIIVFGKNVMKGYFKQPQITNDTIINGWVHTGDLG